MEQPDRHVVSLDFNYHRLQHVDSFPEEMVTVLKGETSPTCLTSSGVIKQMELRSKMDRHFITATPKRLPHGLGNSRLLKEKMMSR